MSVTVPLGFVASGVACGIRKAMPDLAIIRTLQPGTGTAMFTTNRVKAAPLLVSQAHLASAEPQAVVVNSGVANTATGPRGADDAVTTAEEAARRLDLDTDEVLVLSTGLIGVPLPMDKIRRGLPQAAASLSDKGGADAANAIMTTDSRPKMASIAASDFSIGGIAKGAGMIHPALATMLAIITTDYPLQAGEARDFLQPAVESTFNRISVDGECSTNDAVILLANGASNTERRDEEFSAALRDVCADLARQIVADGEGATVVIEINVSGAAGDDEAKAVAERIATSSLVKTAAFGRDANWGRVLVAAGSAVFNGGFARVDPDHLTLAFNDTSVFEHGQPTGIEPTLAGPALRIDLDLGLGQGSAQYLSSDLTHDYVTINADYRT